MSETWTTLKVLDWTSQRFTQAGFESARLEAQVLLAHVLGCDRVALYTRFDQPLHPDELATFRELIKRRLAAEPLAYLVGEQEFWSLPFNVDARVLIPRRDTETLIELVLDETPDRKAALRIADIATGSGAIAITLARELPNASVIATDISADALALARDNAARNQAADRVEFREGDLLAPLAGATVDILVANLPYIPTADLPTLPADVRREPRLALDGGPDGLDLLRRLVHAAPDTLAPGGLLALEHGFDQATAVADIITARDAFSEPRLRKDLGKQPRITYARLRAR
ncbi:MAG TPA: peptide chain release factor N(5)-glutamine methyltransferase [Kofleriaceae bacterium]|nr:peptide chain release factor N(5)-glutamine methyltransferase [Kofleriaceae bacterium]